MNREEKTYNIEDIPVDIEYPVLMVSSVVGRGVYSVGEAVKERLDPSGEGFVRYRHDPADPRSLSHDLVWSIREDRSGTLWIGTGGGGLNRYHPESDDFTAYTEADGLVNGVVYGVLEDDLGRLWISTNDGIARFDRDTGEWASYDVGDGLQDQEFNFGAYHRGADGTMYFGGIGGLNVFRPENFQKDSNPPPV